MHYYYVKKKTIELVIFSKYTIDPNGVIRNSKSGAIVKPHKNKDGYNACGVRNDIGKLCKVMVARALASMIGPPPTPAHTADHKDRDRNNDTIYNIRWATKKQQNDNQERPETYKAAFIVVKDGHEKTANEWVKHFAGEKNSFGRKYTTGIILKYAANKQFGFTYKEYPDLDGEVWREVAGSNTCRGRWEISNMCRAKFITKHAENVLTTDSMGLIAGYPKITINGKHCHCHIVAFAAFYPDEWAMRKPNEMVLHEDDDRQDFRPHKLRLGTQVENGRDAHTNGKYDGTKSERMKCASYLNGKFEREHLGQGDAVIYLKSIGFDKARQGNISMAIDGTYKTAYGRTWVAFVAEDGEDDETPASNDIMFDSE